MKLKVFLAFILINIITLGTGVVHAADGTPFTSNAGTKLVVTAVILGLLVILASILSARSLEPAQKKKLPILTAATMGIAVLGSFIGLLASMAGIIILRSLLNRELSNGIQLFVTFLISGAIVFAAIKLLVGRIIKSPELKLNQLAFITALISNAATIILVFEMINRFIK